MADVFISYAREDREMAKKLARAFQDQGYSVWWDPVIPPGKTWAEVIGVELLMARSVVALWTPRSVTKRWVRKEAGFADEHNKLIPAKLGNAAIPFAFADIQAADLTGWQGEASHEGLQHLMTAISELSRRPPPATGKEEVVDLTEQAEEPYLGSFPADDRFRSSTARTQRPGALPRRFLRALLGAPSSATRTACPARKENWKGLILHVRSALLIGVVVLSALAIVHVTTLHVFDSLNDQLGQPDRPVSRENLDDRYDMLGR